MFANVCVCVCMGACLDMYVRMCVCVRVCMCVSARVIAYLCVRACLRGCVCLRACMHFNSVQFNFIRIALNNRYRLKRLNRPCTYIYLCVFVSTCVFAHVCLSCVLRASASLQGGSG